MMQIMRRSRMEELCEVVTDGTHDSPKLQNEGVPFIKGKHISSGTIDFSNCDFITLEDHEYACKRIKPRRGDILFSNIGSVGDTAVVKSDCEFSIKNVALFRADSRKVDPDYLYYLVLSPEFHANVMNVRSGSAQPFITLGNLRNFEVGYHSDIGEQRRIASILSAYDELIENNQRRIRILEEMARSLYREWFVHFRYPGHESVPLTDSPLGQIPRGWEVRNVKDIANVTYGCALKSQSFNADGNGLPVVRIRDIPTGASETFSAEECDAKYRINDGHILVGMDGDFHMCIWSNGLALQNQRVARFESQGEIGNYHLFLALERPIQEFNMAIVGTTVAHLGDMHIKTIQIIWPPSPLLKKAKEILEPLSEQIITLKRQTTNLRRTRDLLLPRLLSGQVPLATDTPPIYDEDEFKRMVEKGTQAWAGVPDSAAWVETLRGNKE